MSDPKPIAFGEWTPDQPDRKSGANEALGVISVGGHYAPFPTLSDYAGANAASDAVCLGALGVYDTNSDGTMFFGDTSKLYKLVSRVATDISKSGGYSVGTEEWWQFAQFGNYVVAVADSTAPQVYQLGVSTEFADLGGSPPQATTIAAVGDFLMMGKNSTVYWSAFNDITDWTPDPATQAGSQSLRQEHGLIRSIIGGDYAAIFQERAIRRALYVGPPTLWDFGQDPVETRRGCVGPFSAAKWGRVIFFASEDGFYVFDGQSSTPIGYGKVDQYFSSNLNYGYRYKVMCGVDTIRKLVVFGFPSGANTKISELLIYSIQDGRWTHAYDDLDYLFDMPVDPLTVDNFHTYETSDNLDTSNLDAITIDSNVFDDRRRLLAGWRGSNHRLATYTGANRQAIVESAEFEPSPGRRGFVSEVWPIAEALDSNVSVSIGYKRALSGGDVSYTQSTAVNRVGFCPQRIDARFMRARLIVAAGAAWDRLEGVHVKSRVSGGR